MWTSSCGKAISMPAAANHSMVRQLGASPARLEWEQTQRSS